LSISIESINSNQKKRISRVVFFSIFEAILTMISLFLIPPDPKNAFLLGLSWKRWLIVLVTALIFAKLIAWAVNPEPLFRYSEKYRNTNKTKQFIENAGIVTGILLWLAIWFPAHRLGSLGDDYMRVRPLILLFLLISVQFVLILKSLDVRFDLKFIFQKRFLMNRLLLIFAGVVIFASFIFAFLQLTGVEIGSTDPLYFPPSSILTPLQILSAWLVLFLMNRFGKKGKIQFFSNKKWFLAGLFLIWITTFLIWNGTPLPCTGDRPGPDTPNNQCFPPIDDSVYSIGSLYIGLGEGVYNHWLTDKPLYLIFLAVGQALFGSNIDKYLVFQISILALIPILIYFFTKRLLYFSGSLFVAALMVLKGSNEIRYYSSVGGMNVKIENTEGLMSLLLIILAISLFNWFQNPEKRVWGVISGGVLGLCILVRFNPIVILPIVFVVFLWKNRTKFRKVLMGGVLFLLTFLLAVSPWFITARDETGKSFYFQKIQEVIDLRFNKPSSQDFSNGVSHVASIVPPQFSGKNDQSSQIKDFFLHFLNNEYLALAELPVNFSLLSGSKIAEQPIWDNGQLKPIWLMNLSLENYLALGMNLIIVCFGIALLFKKFGITGLIPFLIQTGYFFGNSAVMTSGGRYLIPVGWVTVIHYSVGLLFIIQKLFAWLPTQEKQTFFTLGNANLLSQDLEKRKQSNREIRPLLAWMAFFFLIGCIPYLVNLLPSKFTPVDSVQIKEKTKQVLLDEGAITQAQWDNFLHEPNAIFVQAKAYHPRNYRNKNYFPGMVLFEIMALEKDFVYVSHMVGQEAKYPLGDGSDVILVGCKVGTDVKWNAQRILMKTNLVIQLNNEKNIIIDPDGNWNCAP